MTNTRSASSLSPRSSLLCCVLAAAAPVAMATPPAAQQFHQVVQQQQANDNLQKSQQQQQLRQSVSDNAARPVANNPLMQQQADQATDAQRDRDNATRQSLLDQQRDADQQQISTQDAPPVVNHGH